MSSVLEGHLVVHAVRTGSVPIGRKSFGIDPTLSVVGEEGRSVVKLSTCYKYKERERRNEDISVMKQGKSGLSCLLVSYCFFLNKEHT